MIPKISIIVPVYNVECYLPKCIDSILTQTFPDFELLLVNDGSTDKSGQICEQYKREDERIRVFHKSNGGVSSARNVGINNMVGEYSIHIDGDDYVENDMLEKLSNVLDTTGADIVVSDYYIDSSPNIICINQSVGEEPSDCIKRILLGYIQGFMWNKMIRNDLYKKYDVTFPENIVMGEDIAVIVQLLYHSRKISYIPKAFLHYVRRDTSCVAVRSFASFESEKKLVSLLSDFLCKDRDYDLFIMLFKIFVKSEFLLFGDFEEDVIRDLYPESDPFIFKYPKLGFVDKFSLYTISKNIYCFSRIIKKHRRFKKLIKSVLIRYNYLID